MLSRIKFWQIAALLLLLLNIGMVTYMRMAKPPRHREGPKKHIIEQLNLDSEQVAAYEQLITRHRAAVSAKQQEIHQVKESLYGQLKTTPAPPADSLAIQIGRLQEKLEHIHYQHFQEIKSLCRSEQLPAFNHLAGDLARYFAPPPAPGKQ